MFGQSSHWGNQGPKCLFILFAFPGNANKMNKYLGPLMEQLLFMFSVYGKTKKSVFFCFSLVVNVCLYMLYAASGARYSNKCLDLTIHQWQYPNCSLTLPLLILRHAWVEVHRHCQNLHWNSYIREISVRCNYSLMIFCYICCVGKRLQCRI